MVSEQIFIDYCYDVTMLSRVHPAAVERCITKLDKNVLITDPDQNATVCLRIGLRTNVMFEYL